MYNISLYFITPHSIRNAITKYLCDTYPKKYITFYELVWKNLTNLQPDTWIHIFHWTLKTIPQAWHIHQEI